MPLLTMTPKRSAIFVCHLDSAICHRHFRRAIASWANRSVRRTSFGFLKYSLRIEAANFSTDPAIVSRGVESFDSTNAADAVLQVRPESLDIVADGRDCTHTGDNDSAVVIHLVI